MTDEQKAYELIINRTILKPKLFGTLTYATTRRPAKYSMNPQADYFEFGVNLSKYLQTHLILYGGVGHDHHFHFIATLPEKTMVDDKLCLDVERLWTKGIKSVRLYDTQRPGAWYTLKKHDVFDAGLDKVFCPKKYNECCGKKGCVLERKIELLKRF